MSEWKSIETLFRDWRVTTGTLSGLMITAFGSELLAGNVAWAIFYLAMTLLCWVLIPLVYRSAERGIANVSLRKKLYLMSLPLNVVLIVILGQAFSPWAMLMAVALFVSAFLSGLQSSSEPSLLKRKSDGAA